MNLSWNLRRKTTLVLGGGALTALAVCGVATAQSPDGGSEPSGGAGTYATMDKDGHATFSDTDPSAGKDGVPAQPSGGEGKYATMDKDGHVTFSDTDPSAGKDGVPAQPSGGAGKYATVNKDGHVTFSDTDPSVGKDRAPAQPVQK
ncbi:hypothetical protein [Kitasatospora sp. NPDC096204]|uniref:hypothetical protein n=1 Tax=Kitasatospora sp. NPDC096204 TaxID=3364094 RepID=UPI00381DF171